MDVSLLILTTTIEKQSLLKEYPESVFQIPDMRITDRPDELFEQMHVVEKIKMLILNIDEYPDSYRTVRDQRVVPWIAHSPSLDLKAIAEAETSGACDFILGRLTLEKIFYSFQKNVRFDDNDGKLNIFWQWTLPIRLEYFFAALITRRIPGSPNGVSETLQDLNSPELINENYLLILLCFESHPIGSDNAELLLTSSIPAVFRELDIAVMQVQIDYYRTVFVFHSISSLPEAVQLRSVGEAVIAEGFRIFGSCMSLFIGEPCTIVDLPDSFDTLQWMHHDLHSENRYNEVYCVSQNNTTLPLDPDRSSAWEVMLELGLFDEVKNQIHEEIDALTQSGTVPIVTRTRIIESITDSCKHVLAARQIKEQTLFGRPELSLRFLPSRTSVENMVSYIDMLLDETKDVVYPKETLSSVVDKAKQYISMHISEKLTRELIATNVFVNKDYLSRTFRKAEGISLFTYITKQKFKVAEELLSNTSLSITTISEQLGFSSPAYFCSLFKKTYGMPPALYRREKSKTKRNRTTIVKQRSIERSL